MTTLLLLLISAVAGGQTPANSTPSVTMPANPTTGLCKFSGSHTATVDLTVTAAGLPDDEKIFVSSGDSCLDQQALKAVSAYHFRPAIRDGQAVPTHVRIQVNFKVQ